MKRRDFLTFMGVTALLSPNIQCTVKDKQPNILFLFSDDQRADTIGAYGNTNIHTPNIDGIVKNGYSFRNAYCMGATHGAVCMPSRAMLLSGKSLLSIIKGQQEHVRASLYLTFMESQRAIRDERWKLIRYPKINKTQLFDLQNDIFELNNLVEDPRLTMKINSLMSQLRDWQNQVGDTLALSSDNPEPVEIDLTGKERKPDEHQPEEVIKKYFPEYYKV